MNRSRRDFALTLRCTLHPLRGWTDEESKSEKHGPRTPRSVHAANFPNVIPPAYGILVARVGANKSGRITFQRRSGGVRYLDVSTTFLIVMHPRRETRVMHFIARFNSSVRLFNQTSLPLALVLNVGGCDPFQAAARANGREGEPGENHFARRIRPRALSALGTPAHRATARVAGTLR